MRIQETNQIIKEAQISRLDHERHEEEQSLGSWKAARKAFSNNRALGGLAVAAIATGLGLLMLRRRS